MQQRLAKFIQERPYLSSFLLNLLLFEPVYSIFGPFYQANGDSIVSLIIISIGVVTAPSECVLFMNVLMEVNS